MKFYPSTLAAALLAAFSLGSCQPEEGVVKKEDISPETLNRIHQLGFGTAEVQKIAEGYLVEGDILLTDQELKAQHHPTLLRIGKTEQYRTTNLVSGLPRVIKVSVARTLPAAYVTALNVAIARFNAQGLQLTFKRVNAGANISISPSPSTATYLAVAGFPSQGNPYHSILVNATFLGTNPGTDFLASILAHEIGHGIIPWHADMMFGDTDHTLTPACHEIVEAEANYAAGRMLFLADRFLEEARAIDGSLDSVMKLAVSFGNTKTSTLWRYVEQADPDRPMVALVSGHPHRYKRKPGFDATQPCRHCIQSPAFAHRFGTLSEVELFAHAVSYCGAQRGGLLGEAEIELRDADGAGHIFQFETFFNGHEALTLGRWVRAR